MMELRANWNYPTSVRFGAGRIAELADAVQAAGMRNPLFVTDPNLAKLPMAQQAAVSLGNARIFSDIKSNPVEPTSPPVWTRSNAAGMTAWSPSAAARRWMSAS